MVERIKISLDERLRRAPANIHNSLSVFEMFCDDFFNGMTQLSGDGYYMETYVNYIEKHIGEGNREPILCEMVPICDALPIVEKREMLFRILMEPFARLALHAKGEK